MSAPAASAHVPHSANEKQQSISLSTTSAVTTNPIGATNALVYSTVECFLVAGANPTATVAAGLPIPANMLVPILCEPDDKIAGITSTGTGTIYIRPGA